MSRVSGASGASGASLLPLDNLERLENLAPRGARSKRGGLASLQGRLFMQNYKNLSVLCFAVLELVGVVGQDIEVQRLG